VFQRRLKEAAESDGPAVDPDGDVLRLRDPLDQPGPEAKASRARHRRPASPIQRNTIRREPSVRTISWTPLPTGFRQA
jgi:hypothetical protein